MRLSNSNYLRNSYYVVFLIVCVVINALAGISTSPIGKSMMIYIEFAIPRILLKMNAVIGPPKVLFIAESMFPVRVYYISPSMRAKEEI